MEQTKVILSKAQKPSPRNVYDDGNIPDEDLPKNTHPDYESVEPLPESTRPRKDGPGGGE